MLFGDVQRHGSPVGVGPAWLIGACSLSLSKKRLQDIQRIPGDAKQTSSSGTVL